MLNKSSEKIIAVIPAFNEEGKIGKVVSSIFEQKLVDCVLVIDDCSKDRTGEEARSFGAMVIRHEKNTGVGSSIRDGLDYAKKNGFSIAVVMGGDDQDNPSEMHRLLYPILNDHFVFVQGSRYMAGGERVNIPLFRRVTTGFYSFLISFFVRFPVTDGTNGYRAYRLSILDDSRINLHQAWLDRYELEEYFHYKVIALGMRVTEVPVTKRYPTDHKGYTKMVPVLDWWRVLRPVLYLKLGIKK